MTPFGIMMNHLYVCITLGAAWVALAVAVLMLLDPRPVARIERAELLEVAGDTLAIVAAGERLCACPLTIERRFVHESGQVVELTPVVFEGFTGPGRFEASAEDPIEIPLPPVVRTTPGAWRYEARLEYRRNPLKTVALEQPPIPFTIPPPSPPRQETPP